MPELHRIALRVLGRREDAEDAQQDGLLAAWHNLKTCEGRSRLSTLLTHIIVNSSLMRLRRRAHTVASMDEVTAHIGFSRAVTIVDPRRTPEEGCARAEQWGILSRTLQDLPVVYRSAVWLCDVKGMGTRDAARVLGIPLGTVKSQVTRGCRMISRRVQESQVQAS